jgi:hypothetical protein
LTDTIIYGILWLRLAFERKNVTFAKKQIFYAQTPFRKNKRHFAITFVIVNTLMQPKTEDLTNMSTNYNSKEFTPVEYDATILICLDNVSRTYPVALKKELIRVFCNNPQIRKAYKGPIIKFSNGGKIRLAKSGAPGDETDLMTADYVVLRYPDNPSQPPVFSRSESGSGYSSIGIVDTGIDTYCRDRTAVHWPSANPTDIRKVIKTLFRTMGIDSDLRVSAKGADSGHFTVTPWRYIGRSAPGEPMATVKTRNNTPSLFDFPGLEDGIPQETNIGAGPLRTAFDRWSKRNEIGWPVMIRTMDNDIVRITRLPPYAADPTEEPEPKPVNPIAEKPAAAPIEDDDFSFIMSPELMLPADTPPLEWADKMLGVT